MRIWNKWTIGRYSALCCLVLGLGGCGSLVTLKAWVESEPHTAATNTVIVAPAPKQLDEKTTKQEAQNFALMALFAKVVYRKDLEERVRNEQGCSYLHNGPLALDVGMPKIADKVNGWRRWDEKMGVDPSIAAPCMNKNGFYMETYVHTTDGKNIDMAVIAFRGTENYSWAERIADWTTNLSAVLGLAPHQYAIAEKAVPEVITALQKDNKNAKVYVTGHSLGGGLAQQAGYLDARIEAVYAFAPSPVTNWSNLQLRQNREEVSCKANLLEQPLPNREAQETALEKCKTVVIKNPYPTIYRVSHVNEGLAYVRSVTTRFNTRRFNRSDYEFFFEKGNPVAAHEMGILACHLARLMTDDDRKFDYPRAFSHQIITKKYGDGFPEHPVCPSGKVNLPKEEPTYSSKESK